MILSSLATRNGLQAELTISASSLKSILCIATSYLGGLKEIVASLCDGQVPDQFMELSEVLTQEEEGVLTAWCWWAIPGTELKGSGLIKVDPTGVRSEVITYYMKLSE